MPETGFFTSTSRGFGREWAIAALGDLVQRSGDRLLPLQLDVTDREAVIAAARQAHERFGQKAAHGSRA